jgi:hypothetical protein
VTGAFAVTNPSGVQDTTSYILCLSAYSGRRLYVCRGWSREARDKVAQSDLPWHLGHPTEYPSRSSGIANC